MWKKFLAVMAILGLLSTSAFALAGDPQPGGNGGAVSYIDNFSVTPATFNASKSESAKVEFDLSQAATVYVYVVNEKYEIVGTLWDNVAAQAGHLVATWYGKVGNLQTGAALADGKYQVKAFALSNNAILDFDYKDVSIASTPVVNEQAPKISNLKADPLTFSAAGNEDTEISFNVDKDAYLTVAIKKADTTVKTFADYDNDWYKSTETHSINWNGKDNDAKLVTDGTYTVSVTAKDDNGTNTSTTSIEVKTTTTASKGVIKDLKLDPKTDWDPTDEELSIEFELTSDVKSLTIEAKQGNKVIEILDDEWADDDDYEETWDGTDDDGDYVDEGTWEITVRADGDKVMQTVQLAYEKSEITSAFVTKESFDPSEDEFTNLVFKVDAASVVTVEVYKGSKKEFTLVDEEEVKKNRYYAVEWDGMDEDGDEVDFAKDWKFKITAENSTDDDIFSTATVEVDVEEDETSDKKSNVTNDYTDPIVFDEDGEDTMTIYYNIDEEAEVYLAIYKGESTSGKTEIELLDYVSQEAGSHNVEWNGKNDKNKELKDGIYSYKLISKIGSHKETETGKFVVGNSGAIKDEPPVVEPPVVEPPVVEPPVVEPPSVELECAFYYSDLNYMASDEELCEAISWVTERGIFSGYSDGTFKPYQNINRAEVLKVVLEAFDVDLLPVNGSTEGFKDVDPYAWYMPYVRTAVANSMLDGYSDGTVKLENSVNRVELLKFVLEASKSFTGYEFVTGYYYPTDYYYYDIYADVPYDQSTMWFYEYANAAFQFDLYNTYYSNGKEYLKPAQLVERGEVALLLYRMYQAGLLQ